MALSIFEKLFWKGERETSTIFFFNTLHKSKEKFIPLKEKAVSMYHCGPTVYGYQHIGNYRTYVFADLLKRLFKYTGFNVRQVINITDVGHLTGENEGDADSGEDKIEKGAQREKKTVTEIVKLYTDDFLENLAKLNVDLEETIFPKASDFILEQIAFIQTLEEKGYTYQTSDGIYFDTSLFRAYGKLGNVNLTGLEEGKRVAVNAEKKNPTDFALWKFSNPKDKRQQEWDSPWGTGFPGWHIECSAMSAKLLGRRFDIHTGGVDHIPIHHNNEVAQSDAAFGGKSVNYWLHVAHLRIDDKKISKSLGNVILPIHTEEKGIPLLALRYWFLTSHYRTPVNFTWEALEGAHRAFFRLERFFVDELGLPKGNIHANYQKQFQAAMYDDVDTPKAISILWNLVKDTSIKNPDKKATLLDFDRILGLNLSEAQSFMEESYGRVEKSEITDKVRKLVAEREKARENKNYEEADALREKIEHAGYEIQDTEKGPELRTIRND